jgi:Anaphase-promoting complex subunit 4 WD40 domain
MTGQLALLTLTATDTVTTLLAPMDRGVNALAFSGDGRILAALDGSGECQLYDVATGALLARVTPIETSNTLFVETPDGRFDAPQNAWPRIFRYDGERLVSMTEKADGYTPGLLGQVTAK